MKLVVPSTVPLPRQPQLARSCTASTFLGEAAGVPELRQDEVLNITSRASDGLVYVAACGAPGGFREGWLPAEQVSALTPEEAAGQPPELRLPAREVLRRSTLASVQEDWLDPGNPATLGLRTGEILQISVISKGWAFGWPLECPSRIGWFPCSLVQRLEPSVGSLWRKAPQELSVSASGALVSLLKANVPPPPAQWAWEGDLPQAVMESAQHEERELREHFSHMEAQAAAAALAAQEAEEDNEPGGGGGSHGADAASKLLDIDSVPEDAFPLAVCSMRFHPHEGAKGAMLRLKVGDLVRVTSSLDSTAMWTGFLEKKSTMRGWFPRHHVELLEDPLAPSADCPTALLGPPPLPELPPDLWQQAQLR